MNNMKILKMFINNCCFGCFLKDAPLSTVLRRCYYETPVPPKLNDASYITTRNDIPWKILTGCKVLLIFVILWFGIKTFANSKTCEELVNEALENVGKDYRYYQVYRRKLPKTLKYILLWNYKAHRKILFYKGEGQRTFIRCNCSMINCYITSDRNFFGGDTTRFEAILFNGKKLRSWDVPKQRGAHQKYIYEMTESADNYPVCKETYDNFFNWICSYRLDFNFYCGYFLIKNKYGEFLGPKRDMEWVDMSDIDEPYVHNKTKAAAWFVSNGNTRSKREQFAMNLQRALSRYGLTIDVYGDCGTLKCPKDRREECFNMLEKDYFFYLALENSHDKDYVTEKLLTAVNYNVIPIVYGGANYTRFLPPHSYLDGRQLTIEQLAATMAELIRSKELYQRFFWWKRYYTYEDVSKDFCHSICSLCSALNNITLVSENGVYRQFRRMWNPNYTERCEEIRAVYYERTRFWKRFVVLIHELLDYTLSNIG